MQQVKAEHFLTTHCDLGEGPLWHVGEQCLYWVDIEVGHIHRYFASTASHERLTLGVSIGSFGFRAGGGLILATGKGFALWDVKDREIQFLNNPLEGSVNVRMNDGKVDASGRFWAGSMDRKGNGALYCYHADSTCLTVLKNIKISNGLAWSLDESIFYYTDSGDHAIYQFDFEKTAGEISNRRVFLQLPKDNRLGVPDGLTIDREGFIWSARWDGGKVVRYNPEGEPVLEVLLPVSRVTSVTFGGKDMKDLFITTASNGLAPGLLAEQPLAGDVFVYRSEVSGLAPSFFIG